MALEELQPQRSQKIVLKGEVCEFPQLEFSVKKLTEVKADIFKSIFQNFFDLSFSVQHRDK